MNNKYLIQISTEPIASNDLEVNDWKLDEFFFEQNPWGLGRIEDVDRKETLEELKNLLPKGYVLDTDKETIDLQGGFDYLEETIDRLKNSQPNDIFATYSWWNRDVCQFGDILFFFENGELFTLPEFLFYAMDEGIKKVYIGTVYRYDY